MRCKARIQLLAVVLMGFFMTACGVDFHGYKPQKDIVIDYSAEYAEAQAQLENAQIADTTQLDLTEWMLIGKRTLVATIGGGGSHQHQLAQSPIQFTFNKTWFCPDGTDCLDPMKSSLEVSTSCQHIEFKTYPKHFFDEDGSFESNYIMFYEGGANLNCQKQDDFLMHELAELVNSANSLSVPPIIYQYGNFLYLEIYGSTYILKRK